MQEITCQDCPKRPDCINTCKQSEQYANQDYIGMRESRLPECEFIPAEWPQRTTIESILILYFTDKLNQSQIAEMLYISQQYVSKVINKYRPIIVENIKKSVVSSPK